MRHWTPEERARQAELIKGWKPWAQSTGPISESGKARSAGNATKHGARSAAWKGEREGLLALLDELMYLGNGINAGVSVGEPACQLSSGEIVRL